MANVVYRTGHRSTALDGKVAPGRRDRVGMVIALVGFGLLVFGSALALR